MADISAIKGHVDLLRHARGEKAKWADIEKAAKAAIEEALGADDEGEIGGEVVVRLNRSKVNRLDTKLVKSLYPDVAAECMSTSSSTRLDLVENTEG
ncbi:hypothetical protein SEA_SYRA333_61 [Mycobacterium phage Syra333]|uniref:Uncharacterized protein n=2 Tax=Unicornvirus TaxID=2948939 RepID=A0A222ZMP0_9CAUD|nr:hypothetical protein I5G80_gp084 [Mycobacterium phage Krueger]YP_009951629.1 hypothetical protein I5G82_gp045 [Mycobacterium phage Ximenita]UTN93254.1 hypothetical protein SEA_SUNFLOWER1121_62 [Mycobacterium Phage Sunflower1121]WNM67539.1 hypothetical protein SEA_SHADOW1_61 [Mycobacterium phage Shadow1]WNM69573.1 hypothetical protein SEA_SYRA333_61 [Mycobacterium phage Syra333]ASR85562.1 hypothetical protein SEA_KRUEGER_62 [Mycobacterium phage Krueger]QIG61571.1 hypothetical protein SEA_XI